MTTTTKNLEATNAFLKALAAPAVVTPLLEDSLVQATATELVERQTRYRRMFDDHGVASCQTCRFGGCCRKEFVRVVDVLMRLALRREVLTAVNPNPEFCAFLGEGGCTLTSSIMPNVCISFHCSDLYVRPVAGFAEQSITLASHAEDLSLILRSHLLNQYILRDEEGQLDPMSPVVTLSEIVRGRVTLQKATPGHGLKLKTTPHAIDVAKNYRLPVL